MNCLLFLQWFHKFLHNHFSDDSYDRVLPSQQTCRAWLRQAPPACLRWVLKRQFLWRDPSRLRVALFEFFFFSVVDVFWLVYINKPFLVLLCLKIWRERTLLSLTCTKNFQTSKKWMSELCSENANHLYDNVTFCRIAVCLFCFILPFPYIFFNARCRQKALKWEMQPSLTCSSVVQWYKLHQIMLLLARGHR